MPKPLGVSCPTGMIPTLLGEKTTFAFTVFAFSTNTGCINSELTMTLICLTTVKYKRSDKTIVKIAWIGKEKLLVQLLSIDTIEIAPQDKRIRMG